MLFQFMFFGDTFYRLVLHYAEIKCNQSLSCELLRLFRTIILCICFFKCIPCFIGYNATVQFFKAFSDQCFSGCKNVTFAWMGQFLNWNATEMLAHVFKLFQANVLFSYPLKMPESQRFYVDFGWCKHVTFARTDQILNHNATEVLTQVFLSYFRPIFYFCTACKPPFSRGIKFYICLIGSSFQSQCNSGVGPSPLSNFRPIFFIPLETSENQRCKKGFSEV